MKAPSFIKHPVTDLIIDPAFDSPEVIRHLFHPRRERIAARGLSPERDHFIPVAPDVRVGGCFHMTAPDAASLLFFHGNGEIVSDYDDIVPYYHEMGINFMAVDYRGYGRSDGTPAVSAMLEDAHRIFEYSRKWLAENGYGGPLILMGRSLGSASALELSASYPDDIDGLIIESGFAFAVPLLRLLGADVRGSGIGDSETGGFNHLAKIGIFRKPVLIIHAEQDHIIPFSDGEALFQASRSPVKDFLKIPEANHNNLLYVGFSDYMKAVRRFVGNIVSGP